jgi:collagen type VII alpha
MLQRLMGVSMTVLLGCSGLACGTKARSSADAATGGAAGVGDVLEGGTTDGDAAGGSAGGEPSGGGADGMTTAGAGGGGSAGTSDASGTGGTSGTSGAGGTTGASGAGGTTGVSGAGGTTSASGASGASGLGGAGGAGGSSGGGGDAGSDGGLTDAGFDGPTCTPNVACTPNLPCKTGIVSCDTGVSRCVVTGNQPNGALCGTNVYCVSGFCDNEGCGHACTPTNRCHTGTISCTTGTNICQDTGALVPDGTSCGTDQACKSGACV